MRLIKQVGKLEAAAAARVEDRRAVGIAWTIHEAVVDASALAPGEYIAVDIRMEAGEGGDCQADFWHVFERITTDERDLGVVRNAAGDRIGIVVGLDGGLISWELTDCSPCESASVCPDAIV